MPSRVIDCLPVLTRCCSEVVLSISGTELLLQWTLAKIFSEREKSAQPLLAIRVGIYLPWCNETLPRLLPLLCQAAMFRYYSAILEQERAVSIGTVSERSQHPCDARSAFKRANFGTFFHLITINIILFVSIFYTVFQSDSRAAGVVCLGTKVQPQKSSVFGRSPGREAGDFCS